MKSIVRLIALALMLLVLSPEVEAQQVPQLPTDSAVRIGRLHNGLTYYIRHNERPKGQADFYIAQRVGSILENEDQRGLAHFLEHMCFNGTTNFPGKKLTTWLESVGVKFGYNLNAKTGFDMTVYNISNVPVARESVQDSCLLILHDWANDLLLADDEIDAERAVIHEEWRQSNVGQMRILEKLLPVMYPDNKYGVRLPIGTMEVVDNFPYQALRDYYEAWYRPDQQAVIVVGDINVDLIEEKIKKMFS
ncbi:MAG: insulinase family protein, partial [Paramuribaculum sp.]|nr:insulinase family protein [Paramuribaculum sp.]